MAQQDWISDAWRQKARQQMEDAFSRCSNPFPKSAEEIEKTVYEQWHNAKEKYSAAIQSIVHRAVQAHRQQQLQNMGSQQVMMRPPMQPSQPGQQMGAPQMQSSVPVPSPSTNQNQGPVAQNEEQMYMEKLKQLQKYIDPLSRMINKQEKNSKDLSKMKSLRVVLMDPSKRLAMGTLLKCENVLQNWLDESPKTQPQIPPPSRTDQHTRQQLLDAIASDIKSPMTNRILKRTFGPALQVLMNGIYYAPESSCTKRLRIRKPSDGENSEPGIRVPNVVQGGIAKLESLIRSDSESGQNLEEERLRLVEELRSYADISELPPALIPQPKNVRIEKKEGKLIARWDQPVFSLPLKYSGLCFEEDNRTGKELKVDRFENIEKSYHELQNISPIRYYCVRVWSIASNGQKSSYKTSESVGICKDLGRAFIDEATKLRPEDDYSVYKGYIESASPDPEEVAVKIVPGENLREVEMMHLLAHNNIVTYLASGMVKKGMYIGNAIYIVMELCETKTFWELISDKKMNASECKLALLHIMHGLATIHDEGILHRDLKPQNILRSRDGRNIKIADFGISKKAKANKSKVTKSGMEIGTEGWGSPEHYIGAKMSAKSDIYSAGLVFAFALSGGKHAHGKEAHAWKTRIIDGKPKYDLSILGCEDVKIAEDIIEKMLERRPEDRPTTGDVLTHPFFWDCLKKLQFLHQMSSIFEQFNRKTDQKVPVAASSAVITNVNSQWHIIRTKQQENNWLKKMKEMKGAEERHSFLINNKANEQIGKKNKKKPKYDHSSVTDLIRFIRNIEEHYRDHEELIQEFGDSKENIWKFFSECFPDLLCTVLNAVLKSWSDMKNNDQFPEEAKRFFIDRAPYQPLI